MRDFKLLAGGRSTFQIVGCLTGWILRFIVLKYLTQPSSRFKKGWEVRSNCEIVANIVREQKGKFSAETETAPPVDAAPNLNAKLYNLKKCYPGISWDLKATRKHQRINRSQSRIQWPPNLFRPSRFFSAAQNSFNFAIRNLSLIKLSLISSDLKNRVIMIPGRRTVSSTKN